MRSFFLLLLSLMMGCEASTEVKGCVGGWLQFTCHCPDPLTKYKVINVINGTKTVIQSSKADEWETKDRVSMYHDKSKRNLRDLRVFIKQLQTQDAGEWKCEFGRGSNPPTDTIKLSLDPDRVLCARPFNQTVNKKTKTTITCEYPDYEYGFDIFFCKEIRELRQRGPICEDLLSDRRFTQAKTERGFSVSISEVSFEDEGVYWCGLKSESFQAGVRKINLKVEDIRVFKRKPAVGESFSYWCGYSEGAPITKFICKGDNLSICQPVISSNNTTNGRFSMEDDTEKRNITIRVRDVKAEDSGTYWCGSKSTNTHSDIIYHRFSMTVVPSSSSSSSSVSTTQSTPAEPESPAASAVGSEIVIAVIVCVIALLLLLILSALIYKWFSKQPQSGAAAAAQHNKENYVCEEVPELIQNPDPMKTVYATVDFPRNPSASLLYSTINFERSSDKAAGDGPTLKPSSSACEYSFVKQSPADRHANHQSVPSEEPLYSTVNKK